MNTKCVPIELIEMIAAATDYWTYQKIRHSCRLFFEYLPQRKLIENFQEYVFLVEQCDLEEWEFGKVKDEEEETDYCLDLAFEAKNEVRLHFQDSISLKPSAITTQQQFLYLCHNFLAVEASRFLESRLESASQAHCSSNIDVTTVCTSNLSFGLNYALGMAIAANNSSLARKILALPGVDPSKCEQGTIRVAARIGNADLVQLLLDQPNINPAEVESYAICVASSMGNANVVRVLLQDGRSDPSVDGNYCLRAAAENGHVDVIDALLKDDRVNPSTYPNPSLSPLIVAATSGHLQVVQSLLRDHRVDPSLQNNGAVRVAAYNGHLDIVRFLLEDPRVDPFDDKRSAFKTARKNKDYEMVRLLKTFKTLQVPPLPT